MAGITVIGGGLSGLVLARNLTNLGFNVRVVETRGRIGGISILDKEAMSIIDRIIGDVNVEKYTTAVRVGGTVKIISSNGVEDVSFGITATGFRVLTLTELNIKGDRPAGVYAYHAVLDLISENLLPGRHIVVYGLNRYSLLLAKELLNYTRRVYIVDPRATSDHVMGEVEVLKGKIRGVKGHARLSRIILDKGVIEADTLIISMFKPWNQFPEFEAVGHAAIEVYDPRAIVEASRLQAINIACEEHAKVGVEVRDPRVQVFPRIISRCLREIFIVKPGGGKVVINGRVYDLTGDYIIINIPKDVDIIEVSSL